VKRTRYSGISWAFCVWRFPITPTLSSFLSITDLSAHTMARRQKHQVVFMGLEIIPTLIGVLALLAGLFFWFEAQKTKKAYNLGLANLEEERASLAKNKSAQLSSKPAKAQKSKDSKESKTEPSQPAAQAASDSALAKELREKEKALTDA